MQPSSSLLGWSDQSNVPQVPGNTSVTGYLIDDGLNCIPFAMSSIALDARTGG